MKSQNLIKKIAVLSSIFVSLSGNMFAMNTTPSGSLENISGNKKNVSMYKSLADRIVSAIAHDFYPRNGQIVQGIGDFWIEREEASEFMTAMMVVTRCNEKNAFNLDTLARDLKAFQSTRKKVTYRWKFVGRDEELLCLIAQAFRGDSDSFRESLLNSWRELAPYGHLFETEQINMSGTIGD